jgi:hypothetical protein
MENEDDPLNIFKPAPEEADLTFGEWELLSQEEQDQYTRNRARALGGRCDACEIGFDAGTSSFTEMLCKLWHWIVGAVKAIVDGIKTVLVDLVKAVFEVLKPIIGGLLDIGGSLFSSPIFWVIGGLAAWYFLGGMKDDEPQQYYGQGG